jgi:hypothetical protein
VITELLTASRAAVLICLVAAACLPIAARAVTGPRGAHVHVRWEESLDPAARQRLEARFRLTDGKHLEGSTWEYDLLDPSPDIIRALVRDRAVADTHHIDRSRLIPEGADRTARRGRIDYGDALVTAADGVAIALATFVAILALSQMAPVAAVWSRGRGLVFRAKDQVAPYVLVTIGVAVYAAALRFPPTNGDDLAYLASVATTENPLNYFVQDHGHGNGLYRPLTSASMWVIYQAFGVWALPNQIINLVLHMANVFLLFRIVRREQADTTLALLFAAVFMVSKYTFLAATWTSDRPMVLTGLFLLLLINHLSQHDERSGNTSGASVRVAAVAAFSVLALMSKESGLVVPAVALLFALTLGGAVHFSPRHRLTLAVVSASIMGLYVVFRGLIFGSGFASYSQDGYMFLGLVHYEDSGALPPLLRYLNYAENLTKNALAPVLPIFPDGVELLEEQSLLIELPVMMSTALLFGLAVSRHLTRLQRIALIIILVNAVVHFPLFRFRLHYLSHAAFCMFVASSPHFTDSWDHRGKKLAVKVLAVITLVGGILWTTNMLNAHMVERNRELNKLPIEDSRTDLEEQVLLKYK